MSGRHIGYHTSVGAHCLDITKQRKEWPEEGPESGERCDKPTDRQTDEIVKPQNYDSTTYTYPSCLSGICYLPTELAATQPLNVSLGAF